MSKSSAPLSDSIITAVSRLVDDAQTTTREPSHSEIEFQIDRCGLKAGDPKTHGQNVGKAKRVRAALSWALENNYAGGVNFVTRLLGVIQGCGGFRETSPNYVGKDVFIDTVVAFRSEGYVLTSDGNLQPLLLDNLLGTELTQALEAYARRAKRGADDAALVTGTGKDLLEATAAHVLSERWGSYPTNSNFPTLLGQAFVALNLSTPQDTPKQGEPVHKRLERAMYELGCAVNQLRNKEGTGHGRPFISSISESDAKVAIECMGIVAERLLISLKQNKIP